MPPNYAKILKSGHLPPASLYGWDFARVLKANPYHDALGRFSSEDTATYVSLWGRTEPALFDVPAKNKREYPTMEVEEGDYGEFNAHHKGHLDRSPDKHREAVVKYTSSYYADINNYHRKSKGSMGIDTAAVEHTTKMIEKVLEDSTLGKDLTLFRGVSGQFARDLEERHTQGKLVGAVLQDPGFTSSTIDKETAKSWGETVMELKVRKEQPALYVGSDFDATKRYSMYETEYEVVLPRNTPMVVTKAWKDSNSGKFHMELDVLPPGKKAKK